MKVGELVRIKTPNFVCRGVYNGKLAKISRISDSEICYVDLIKPRDSFQVLERGFVPKGIMIKLQYCYPIKNKLNI